MRMSIKLCSMCYIAAVLETDFVIELGYEGTSLLTKPQTYVINELPIVMIDGEHSPIVTYRHCSHNSK